MLALSLVVAAGLGGRYRDARVDIARLEAQSGLVMPERPAKPIPRERIEEEARNAEAVVRQLTLPWAALIATIEQAAATKDVAILQLQPDAENKLLRLTAETLQREAMFNFVRRLADAPLLEEHRTGRFQLYESRGDEQHRRQQQEQ